MQIEIIETEACDLGESPVWDERLQALYWVDIERGKVLRWSSHGGQNAWQLPRRVGSVVLTENPTVLAVALEDVFAFLDLGTGAVEPVPMPQPIAPVTRFNDGKCDPHGRFWAGTMSEKPGRPAEAGLYCLQPDLSVTLVYSGISVANSLAWSPDGVTLYFADSPKREIVAFSLDSLGWPEQGPPSHHVSFAPDEGVPDGSVSDAAGNLWTAVWDGWKIRQTRPDGQHGDDLRLPVSRPTSCAFGGPKLCDLFVTTARFELDAHDLRSQPDAGKVLRIRNAAQGLPAARFALSVRKDLPTLNRELPRPQIPS